MIVASQFGWSAISTQPMNFREFQFARQLGWELHTGTKMREADRMKEAREREAMKRAKSSSRR